MWSSSAPSSFPHTLVFSLIESLHVESYLGVCLLENWTTTVTTTPWVKQFSSPSLTVPYCEIRKVAQMLSKVPFSSTLTFQLRLGPVLCCATLLGLILKIQSRVSTYSGWALFYTSCFSLLHMTIHNATRPQVSPQPSRVIVHV